MKLNQLKAGAALSYISMGISFIISIAFTPIMLRLLGQSQYGLYNLVASIVAYLGLLNFGFGSAYIRYYSRYKAVDNQENIAKLNGMFLIVFSVIGLIAVIAGALLVLNIDCLLGKNLSASELATAKILMVIMVFNTAVAFPTSVFSANIMANEKFIFQKIIQMITTVISPFVMLPVLLLGYKSVGMVVVSTGISLIVQISNATFCLKKLKMKFVFNDFDFYLMREMTIFSSYVFLNMITDQINWNVDKFIVGRFRGTVAVAIYGLAAQLNAYYLTLSTAISSVFIPKINKMVALTNDNNELTDLFTRIGRIQFMLLSLICTGLIFFGQPFINMWAGTDYNDSYQIMLLLVIPVTIPLIQSIGVEIQKAKDMHKFRSWVYLFIAMGNILLSIPLTKMYGGIGAALGTAIAILLGNGVMMNWYYHKKVGLDMKYFWSQIFRFVPSLIVPVLIGTLMCLFIDLYSIKEFFICGIFYLIIFCFSMWFLGMNNYEKNLLAQPTVKMFKKIKGR